MPSRGLTDQASRTSLPTHEPQRWKLVEHVRKKMKCRDWESVTRDAGPVLPDPARLRRPEPAGKRPIVEVHDSPTAEPQSDVFAREGIAIDTWTLADRVGACAVALAPIVDATASRAGGGSDRRCERDQMSISNAAALRGSSLDRHKGGSTNVLLWNKTLSVPSGLVGSTAAIRHHCGGSVYAVIVIRVARSRSGHYLWGS